MLGGLTTEDGNLQGNGNFDILVRGAYAWDDVGLPPLNQILDPLESLRAVQEHLREAEVVGEAVGVLWDYDMYSGLRALNVSDF